MAKAKEKRLSDVVRILNLIPYFQSHPGISLMEASRELGCSIGELKNDLDRLWCCGAPGLQPGDLVDMERSYVSVTITNSQGMDRPLRLTPIEAGALLLALEALEARGSIVDTAPIVSAAHKLRAALGEEPVAVDDAPAPIPRFDPSVAVTIHQAVREDRQLRIIYQGTHDTQPAERTISPAHVFDHATHTYLLAWDHGRNDERVFRLDRISSAECSNVSRSLPSFLSHTPADPFHLEKADVHVDIELRSEALWVTDYVPIQLGDAPRGEWFPATVAVNDAHWFRGFIAGLGEYARIVGPDEVRAECVEKVAQSLKVYDDL